MEKHEIICVGNNDIRKFRVKKTTYYLDHFDETTKVVVSDVFVEVIYKLQVKIFGIWITLKQYKSHKEEDDKYFYKCFICDYNKFID